MSHSIPLLITEHILGKKVSLIVFRHKLYQKFWLVVHIFSFTIITYLKNLIGVKSFNTKQCPAGFPPRIMPSFPVSSKMYPPFYQNTATKIKRLIHFFSLKLVDVSSFTKGHHQNYCEIRKQHHVIKFKSEFSVQTSIK